MSNNYDDEDFLVTPQWAYKELQKRYPKFRGKLKLDETRYKKARKLVDEGDAQLRDRPISYAKSGRLLNGCHRLQACVDSNKSFWIKKRTYK